MNIIPVFETFVFCLNSRRNATNSPSVPLLSMVESARMGLII